MRLATPVARRRCGARGCLREGLFGLLGVFPACDDEFPHPAADRKRIRLNGRIFLRLPTERWCRSSRGAHRLHLNRQAPIAPHQNPSDGPLEYLADSSLFLNPLQSFSSAPGTPRENKSSESLDLILSSRTLRHTHADKVGHEQAGDSVDTRHPMRAQGAHRGVLGQIPIQRPSRSRRLDRPRRQE